MTRKIISGDREIAVDAMLANAARAASGLEQLGLKPGDAIATFLRNDFPNFEVGVAASMLALYAVPINWHYGPEEAGYVLEDCGARALVVHSDLLQTLRWVRTFGDIVFIVGALAVTWQVVKGLFFPNLQPEADNSNEAITEQA